MSSHEGIERGHNSTKRQVKHVPIPGETPIYGELGEYPYYGPYGDGFSLPYMEYLYNQFEPWNMRHQIPDLLWWTPHAPNSRQFEEGRRGAFAEAYPHWYPYFPLGTYHPSWLDTWATQGYQGHWWP